MPTVWRKAFSRPWWDSSRPFPRLVRHFLVRLVRGEEDPASSEVQLGAGALLGLLSVPGAVTCFILLDKYSTLLNWIRGVHQDVFLVSLPDKYLFLSLAMAITGIVTVLKWDKILPDSQDYLNLAPLPLRPRTVLAANATAIAIAAIVFAVDANSIPAVLFPLFVSCGGELGMDGYFHFAALHALCVISASLFTFVAVFAFLGAISAILPRQTFRTISSWVRGLILIAFLALLVSGAVGPGALLRNLRADPHSPVRFLPSLWFLALYQTSQNRGIPMLFDLARRIAPASAAVLAIAVAAYGFSYRRRFAASLEGGPSGQRLSAAMFRVLDLFAAGAGDFVRAGYRFTVRALLRNESHRVCVAVAIGIGWLAGWHNGVLAAPLSAAYILVLGLRFALEVPAGANAAWIFRALLDPREHDTLSLARRVMLSFLTLLVIVPSMALAWWSAGFPTALLHVLYLLALSSCLVEAQLAGYRKIPLTCPIPGFRDRLLVVCLAQILGFMFFTHAGASMELWMLAAPPRFLLVPLGMAGAWSWNRRRLRQARDAGELEEGLTFENIHVPAVERLNL